jgi:hypothetical protein
MAWTVDATPRPVSRGNQFYHLLRAELRQYWWLQPAVLAAGLGVWALLTVVTERVPTNARPDGVVFNNMASLLLSVFPLLLAGPVMAGLGSLNRLGLFFGLPLSRRKINLLRILSSLISLWPVTLTWPLILSLLDRVYGPVSPWVPVNSALLIGLGIILSQRTPAAAFLIYILLPIQGALAHFIPGGQAPASAWAEVFSSPWMGAALLVAEAGLLAYVLTSHPPRKE